MNSAAKALKQGAKCIYIAVEASVAGDVSQRMLNGAAEIERLTTEGARLTLALNDLISSAEATVEMMRNSDDAVDRLDAVPYLLNRIMVARKASRSVSATPDKEREPNDS